MNNKIIIFIFILLCFSYSTPSRDDRSYQTTIGRTTQTNRQRMITGTQQMHEGQKNTQRKVPLQPEIVQNPTTVRDYLQITSKPIYPRN